MVAYLGRREITSIPNVCWGRLARLGESLGMLHMNFDSLMRSLSSLSGMEKGVT